MSTEPTIVPTAPTDVPRETPAATIERIFRSQQEARLQRGATSLRERRERLKALHNAVLKYRPAIKEALFADHRKHPSEVDLVEIYPVIGELKHARRHLAEWMADRRVPTPLAFLGASSRIKYEPKGTALIISPWNFPVSLSFGPLVSALAAGNRVMIKPSERTPHTASVIGRIVAETFAENEVAVVQGGVATSTALLSLPFNHIFFTGSPEVGKLVMTAAAGHLSSVTLELGGRSPCIVDETADLDVAAGRIAWSKFVNNGQICIAPDHVLIHESRKEAFVQKVLDHVRRLYPGDPANEPSYCRVVDARHFERLKGYVDDAVAKGGRVRIGGTFDATQNFIAPTVMTDVPESCALMSHEIFGPVLPIITFTRIEDVIQRVNRGAKPLALYIYSRNRRVIRQILNNTRAGGSCVNHSAVHFYDPYLPFGGSNNSGIGKGHGRFGFEEFSNARAVLVQHFRGPTELLMAPYNSFKQKLIDLTIRYL